MPFWAKFAESQLGVRRPRPHNELSLEIFIGMLGVKLDGDFPSGLPAPGTGRTVMKLTRRQASP